MKIEQFYWLKEIAKYHSISVVAEKNYISQSSVSYAIQCLEKELGAELLKRSSQGVVLTPAGMQILNISEDIFSSVEKIKQIACESKRGGQVQISCIPCICDDIMPSVVQYLKSNEIPIVISVETKDSKEVIKDVLSGQNTVGITIQSAELKKAQDLNVLPLFTDEYQLYVGEHSPYWNSESVTYEEVLSLPHIAYKDELLSPSDSLSEIIGDRRLPRVAFRANDLNAIRNLISNSECVAFFPRKMSRHDIYVETGRIRPIPVSDRDLHFEVVRIESQKYKRTAPDDLFIESLESVLEKLAIE